MVFNGYLLHTHTHTHTASQVAVVVKNLPVNAGDARDMGSIPGMRRLLGEGNGSPPLYSCLGNPMDRGAWWAIVHGVAKSWTWQRIEHTHTYLNNHMLLYT